MKLSQPVKKIVLFFVVIMLFTIGWMGFAKNRTVIMLKESEVVDLEDKLDDNEIYLRNVAGFDYDGNYLYYLDSYYCCIYKVKADTFQLVKVISSPGQAPAELSMPVGLSCKNGKLYVLDAGFGGVKIFDTDGKALKQFRIKGLSLGMGTLLRYLIGVNSNEEIFIRGNSPINGMMLSVYNTNGDRLRGLIPVNIETKNYKKLLYAQFIFVLDQESNVIVLFSKEGKLEKFDKKGKRLWTRDILQLLPEDEKDESGLKNYSNGSMGATFNFSGLALRDDNRIFVSSRFAGLMFSNDGYIQNIFKHPIGKSVFGNLILWIGNRLLFLDKQFDFNRYIHHD